MRVSRFAALIAAALCLSCSDSFAPGPSFAGDYALSTVNGQALPSNFSFNGNGIRWLSGSVSALPSQGFSRQLVQEQWSGGILEQTDTVYFEDSRAFFRAHGAVIHFYDAEWSLMGVLDTVEIFSGALNADGSVLTILANDGLAGANSQFRYER